MNRRPLPIVPGEEAWIKRSPRDGLSETLPHNQSVVVLRLEGHWAFIRDNLGRQRRIPIVNLDAGCEYEARSGRWLYEDHVVVQRSIARFIARLEEENASPDEIARWQGILDRHPDVEL